MNRSHALVFGTIVLAISAPWSVAQNPTLAPGATPVQSRAPVPAAEAQPRQVPQANPDPAASSASPVSPGEIPLPGEDGTQSATPADSPSLIPSLPPAVERPTPPSRADIPPAPDLTKSKTATSEAELQGRIRFRQVKTRALNDPAVQEQWARAQSAHTDPEKRDALREYYTRLYGRMLKLDGSLKGQIELRREAALNRLEQKRIEPEDDEDDSLRTADQRSE